MLQTTQTAAVDADPPPKTVTRNALVDLWTTTPYRPVAGLFVVLGIAACFAHAVAYWSYTVDDAYIFFRYADNWAAGHGLVYNPGERVEGYTSFLWVLLVGVGVHAGISAQLWAKILGMSCGLGTLVVLLRLTSRVGASPWIAAAGIGLLATSDIFAISLVEGLETPLFTLCCLGALHRFHSERSHPGAVPWSMALAMLAFLTRPDGILWALLLLLMGLLLARPGQPDADRWRRWCAVAALVLLGVVVAHTTWRFVYYGDLLPNTFYAKGGGSLDLFGRGLSKVIHFTGHVGGPLLWLLPLMLTLSRRWRAVAILAVLFIASRLFFTVWSGGAWLGHYRFLAPAVPLFCLLSMAAVREILHRWVDGSNRPHRAVTAGVALSLALLAGFNVLSSRETHDAKKVYSEGLENAHLAAGRDLRDMAQPDDLLACGEAGALPYVAGLPTLDILGLNDAHIGHLPGTFYYKYDLDYILDRSPDYFVLLSATPRDQGFDPLTPVGGALVDLARFRGEYRYVRDYRFARRYYLWLFEARPEP